MGFEVQLVTDKTTMSVRPDQKDAIEELTGEYEPLYVGIDRLLEAYDDGHSDPLAGDEMPDLSDEITVDESEIARQVTKDLLNQLPPKLAEELQQ